MTAGTVLVIPPGIRRTEFVCTEDTIDIDFFAPQRQDWLDGAPSVSSGKMTVLSYSATHEASIEQLRT